MFADNTTFMAHNHQDAQEIITCFLKSAKAFRLKIHLKKTKVTFQPLLGSYDIGQDIKIESQVSTQINKFKYFSFTVTTNNRLDVDLDTWTLNASKALASWGSKSDSTATSP